MVYPSNIIRDPDVGDRVQNAFAMLPKVDNIYAKGKTQQFSIHTKRQPIPANNH